MFIAMNTANIQYIYIMLTIQNEELTIFLNGKSEHALKLYNHFIAEFQKIGPVTMHPAKTMIGIAGSNGRVAYVTQFGKSFITIVFPFKQAFRDNTCFEKLAQVPGISNQFNHHLRMMHEQDLNHEVKEFMKMAIEGNF